MLVPGCNPKQGGSECTARLPPDTGFGGFLGSQIRKAGKNGMLGSSNLVVVTVKLSCVKLLLEADSRRIKMPPWFDNCMQGSLEGVRKALYGG